MADNQTLADTADTGTTDQQTNQADRLYTQKELDDMMARTKSSVAKKFQSKYEDLGDPDELREIVSSYRKQQTDQQVKRGEFEKVLQDLASKKDAEIQKRDRIIEAYKVETPILDAAARMRAVNPEQVKALIRNNVRLNGDGDVEVLDEKGAVRYDDAGRPLSVDNFVQTWLQQNPHFVQPTPSTSATKSNVGFTQDKIDLSKLDMSDPAHRKIYAESRKTR
jgi:hypothetical protein